MVWLWKGIFDSHPEAPDPKPPKKPMKHESHHNWEMLHGTWNIYLHEYVKCMINVGKYSSPKHFGEKVAASKKQDEHFPPFLVSMSTSMTEMIRRSFGWFVSAGCCGSFSPKSARGFTNLGRKKWLWKFSFRRGLAEILGTHHFPTNCHQP